MSTSSGYVLAGEDLDKLEFWHWYHWAVRTGWRLPFRVAIRVSRIDWRRLTEVWPIDL